MHRENIFGIHAVRAILSKRPGSVLQLHVLSGSSNRRIDEIVKIAMEHSIPVAYQNRRDLDQMVSGNHQGVIAEIGAIKYQRQNQDLTAFLEEIEHAPLLLILDGVQDPHNLGAALRTANAAGVDAVIAPKDKAASITPTVRKVASGAAEVTPFFQVTNLSRTIEQLKSMDIWCFGLSDKATKSIYEVNLLGPMALVLGAEGKGLRRLTMERCDDLLSIPMFGTVSSLNVSVAAGVSLFEAVRQRTASFFSI